MDDTVKDLMAKYFISAYIQTSALTGYNVDVLFQALASLLDTLFPPNQFDVVPTEPIKPVSLVNILSKPSNWTCF